MVRKKTKIYIGVHFLSEILIIDYQSVVVATNTMTFSFEFQFEFLLIIQELARADLRPADWCLSV